MDVTAEPEFNSGAHESMWTTKSREALWILRQPAMFSKNWFMEQTFAKSVKTMSFIVTRDRAKSKAFYGDLLEFALVSEDDFAAVFDMNGILLRISTVPTHVAAAHTVLGWAVPDAVAAVKSLRSKGVNFNVYPGLGQDELGIWKPPGSETQVAWFFDPDGNNLSVTQF